MSLIRIAAVFVSLAFGLTPAFAQSPQTSAVADTLQKWGLIGTWSLDCSRPPAGNHIYIRYVAWLGGKVMTERDYGDKDRNDSNEVTSATFNQDGSLTMVVDFQSLGQIRTFALERDRPDRVRALWNRGPDGVYSVKDGRFTANGNETPWQYKCN
jgi:hypothetical protein